MTQLLFELCGGFNFAFQAKQQNTAKGSPGLHCFCSLLPAFLQPLSQW